jgi:hypothetical protein
MPNFAMITENGLNQIDQAHPLGQYIEIAYYVPVYDYRIDETILPTNTSFSATDILTVTSSSDLVPVGEVLWNTTDVNAYALSTDQKYLVVSGGETITPNGGDNDVAPFAHREVFNVNTFLTSSVGGYFTGDTVTSPGTQGTEWKFSTAGYAVTSALTSADGFGPDDSENPIGSDLFTGVTYQHVITSADDSRANFKITMRCPVGQIRFNKVGLYGVRRSADGVIITDPFLFAQVIIPEPQVMYTNQVGSSNFALTELTLDFQIESKTTTADFEEVFYSTSGDYWVRTTNESDGVHGLLTDGSVYITNRLAVDEFNNIYETSADRSVAKLLVSTFETINHQNSDVEQGMPQLCLQYGDNTGMDTRRIRTTFRTNVNGDCVIDMYGACTSGVDDKFSLIPAIDREYGLGLITNRWHHLSLGDSFEMLIADESDLYLADFEESYIKFNATNKNASFYNTDVAIGPYYSSADMDDDNVISKNDNTNYMYGNISSYRTSATKGDVTSVADTDLLIRSLNDVIMLTLDKDAAQESWATAEGIVSRSWALLNNESPNILESLGENKDVIIGAGRNIYTIGGLLPMQNLTDKLGDWDNQWVDVFTQRITGWNRDDGNNRNLVVHSNLVPEGGYSIKENPYIDDEFWKEITALQFNRSEFITNNGRDNSLTSVGYFTSVKTDNIVLDSSDDDGIRITDGFRMKRQELYTTEDKTADIGKSDRYIRRLYVDKIFVNNLALSNTVEIVDYNNYTFNAGNSDAVAPNGWDDDSVIQLRNIELRKTVLNGEIEFTLQFFVILKNYGGSAFWVNNGDAMFYMGSSTDGFANQFNLDPNKLTLLSTNSYGFSEKTSNGAEPDAHFVYSQSNDSVAFVSSSRFFMNSNLSVPELRNRESKWFDMKFKYTGTV